jgi:cupin 2 domain-containing protein
MLAASGNLFDATPGDARQEVVMRLLDTPGLKIERIVSMGQSSPPGFWYDQPWSEWVVVMTGEAALCFEGEADIRILRPGDYVLIPARQKHRVEWTSQNHATIWLTVHYPESE